MKGVQCYELFGGIALWNHAFFIISFSHTAFYFICYPLQIVSRFSSSVGNIII